MVCLLFLISTTQASSPVLPQITQCNNEERGGPDLLLSHVQVHLTCTHTTRESSTLFPKQGVGPALRVAACAGKQGQFFRSHAPRSSLPPVTDGKERCGEGLGGGSTYFPYLFHLMAYEGRGWGISPALPTTDLAH